MTPNDSEAAEPAGNPNYSKDTITDEDRERARLFYPNNQPMSDADLEMLKALGHI